MVYAFGIGGFVCGFAFGLFVISLFLKSFSNSDLVRNKSLRWTYGVAVWLFAGIGVYAGLFLHGRYFG